MTAQARIIQQLSELHGPACDDCLSELAILPQRQVANQICRRLAAQNIIQRGQGSCARCSYKKIVNAISVLPASVVQNARLETAKSADSRTAVSEWFWEGNVVSSLVGYLSRQGWQIYGVADTKTHERGVDIRASRDGGEMLIEVKGYPSKVYRNEARHAELKKTNPTVQARVWYSEAMLKAMQLQNEYPTAQVAIGLPNLPRYVALIQSTQTSRAKLGIKILLVDEVGNVEVV